MSNPFVLDCSMRSKTFTAFFILLLFDDGELASNGSDILFGQFETFVFVSEGFVVVVDCWRNYQVRSFYFTSRLVVVFLCLLLFAIAMPVT